MQTIPLNTDSSPDAVLELLFKLKVKDVMTSGVFTASPQNTIREIQLLMKRSRVTGVPIIHEDRTIAGIVSMEDIVNSFDNNWMQDTAEQHMTKKVIVMQESMPVSFCVTYFNRYRFGRFPVVDKDSHLTGIVTTTDVISALLVAMNKEVERLEHQQNAQPATAENTNADESDSVSTCCTAALHSAAETEEVLEFQTEPFNFETAGHASTEIKRRLKAAHVDTALTRRIGIASYELEINQVVHSEGGVMRYIITPEKLIIEAADTGPGIPDIHKALTEGFSTATDKVRALGFGAGMGLPNTRRVSDFFDISSDLTHGTVVHAVFMLKPQEDGAV